MEHELILVDNSEGVYTSAAAALNYGGNQASGDLIMFVHQDVDLCSQLWLDKVERCLDKLDNWGIVGVAGKAVLRQSVISNIYQGDPPLRASPDRFQKSVKVQTVDECLMIIPRSLFKEIQFDEKTCHDWHLYGVDFCLTIKKRGYEVCVLPYCVYHHSPGYSFSEEYDITLEKLLQKHSTEYRFITTTLGEWFTFYPLKYQFKYPELKNKLIHGLRKLKML
jgi:GT2 family glycosyltransferase